MFRNIDVLRQCHYICTHTHARTHHSSKYHKAYYAAVEKVPLSVSEDHISRSLHSRKVYLELYIPCTICVFGGTPFRCLPWLSSMQMTVPGTVRS